MQDLNKIPEMLSELLKVRVKVETTLEQLQDIKNDKAAEERLGFSMYSIRIK